MENVELMSRDSLIVIIALVCYSLAVGIFLMLESVQRSIKAKNKFSVYVIG